MQDRNKKLKQNVFLSSLPDVTDVFIAGKS
jgi:hypothetical protein